MKLIDLALPCVTFVFLAGCLKASDGWVRVGPFGGGANLVRVSASKPDMVLAATRSGIIFQSDDRGAQWHIASGAPSSSCILHALAMDPQQESVWYAGFECERPVYSGLYVTRDSGKTWDTAQELRGEPIWSIALSKSGDKVATGGANGVYLSEDGTHWARISAPENQDLKPVVSLNFDRHDENTLYAGTTHLPWRTQDLGKTWQSIHGGMHDDSDVFSIEPDPHQKDRVFASACSGAYASGNDGSLWARLPTPRGAFRSYFIAVDPHTRDLLYVATSAGLFRSADGGKLWDKISADIVKSVAFDLSRPGVIYFASASEGILSTVDGGKTLRRVKNGFSNLNYCGLAASDGRVFVGERGSAGCQFVEGSHEGDWTPLATPAPVSGIAASGNTLLVESGSRVWRSHNAGKTWTELPRTPASTISVAQAPTGDFPVFAVSHSGLFRLDRQSTIWHRTTLPLTFVQSGTVEAWHDGSVTAVTNNTAFFSVNGGSDWTPCRASASDLVWYGFAFREGAEKFGLAATSRGLFRINDSCDTWTPVEGGLSRGTVSLIYQHPTNPDVFVAAQDGRTFVSMDGGRQWRRLSDEGRFGLFPEYYAIDPATPSRIYALFPGLGVSYQDFEPEPASASAVESKEMPQR